MPHNLQVPTSSMLWVSNRTGSWLAWWTRPCTSSQELLTKGTAELAGAHLLRAGGVEGIPQIVGVHVQIPSRVWPSGWVASSRCRRPAKSRWLRPAFASAGGQREWPGLARSAPTGRRSYSGGGRAVSGSLGSTRRTWLRELISSLAKTLPRW